MAGTPVNIRDVNSSSPNGITSVGSQLSTAVGLPALDLNRFSVTNIFPKMVFFENAGSPDMTVDGSITPVEFSVTGLFGTQKKIHGVRFIIESGNNMDLNTSDRKSFGSAGVLANGIQIIVYFLDAAAVGSNVLASPVRTIEDLLLYSIPGTFVNLLRHTASSPDLVICDLVWNREIVFPFDTSGTSDRVSIKVSDDLTSLSSFRALAFTTEEQR